MCLFYVQEEGRDLGLNRYLVPRERSIQTKIYQEGKWQLNEKFNKHRIDYKQQNGVKGET